MKIGEILDYAVAEQAVQIPFNRQEISPTLATLCLLDGHQ